MYLEHWGLNTKPFVNAPDPRFLYGTSQHTGALHQLEFAVAEQMSAALLTGMPGIGKTLIALTLRDRLDPAQFAVFMISHPNPDPLELLLSIALEMGEESLPLTRSELLTPVIISSIKQRLEENRIGGREAVLIVDEAHLLKGVEVFEHLRMLLNLQLGDRPLLTLLLIGQPELYQSIDRIGQLEQRVGVKCSLKGLTREETERYISHRLNVAGREKPIFNPGAMDLVFEFSAGIPREINRLSVLCLLAGFLEDSHEIDETIVWAQVRNLTSGEIPIAALQEADLNQVRGPVAVPATGEKPRSPVVGIEGSPAITDAEPLTGSEIVSPETDGITLLIQNTEELYSHALSITRGVYGRARRGESIDHSVIEAMVKRLTDHMVDSPEPMMELFFESSTEDYLCVHAVNTTILNLLLGSNMGLDHDDLQKVGLSGLLHAIGLVKAVEYRHWVGPSAVAAPSIDSMGSILGLDEIINQPRSLTEEERAELKNGPLYARETVTSISGIDPQVADIVYQHKERVDGEGYPEGLEGEEIHPHAQLISVCCVFEALTHPRKHRGKRFPDEAARMITLLAGRQFNPELVTELIRYVGFFPVSWWVELSTGEAGRVVKVNPRAPTRPVVEVMFNSTGKRLAQPKLVDLARTPHDRILKMIDSHFV